MHDSFSMTKTTGCLKTHGATGKGTATEETDGFSALCLLLDRLPEIWFPLAAAIIYSELVVKSR